MSRRSDMVGKCLGVKGPQVQVLSSRPGSKAGGDSRDCDVRTHERRTWKGPVCDGVRPGSEGRTRCRSEVENKPRTAGSGHADHHAVADRSFVLVEDRVAVVRFAIDDRYLAGATGALATRGEDGDSGFLDHVEDGQLRQNGQGQLALGEDDLDRTSSSFIPSLRRRKDGWSFTPIRNTSASWRTISQLEQRIRPRAQRPVELPPEPVEITSPDRGVTPPRRPGIGHTEHRGHRFRLRALWKEPEEDQAVAVPCLADTPDDRHQQPPSTSAG